MLYVLLGGKAGDRILLAAPTLGVTGENLCPILARRAAPSAGRVDQVGLNVEDELVSRQDVRGGCGLESALLGQTKNTARVAKRGEGFVQCKERGGRAAERLQECPTSESDTLGIFTDLLLCLAVGPGDMLS